MRPARVAVSAALLAGCHPAVELTVQEERHAPVISVRQEDGQACLRSLGVYRLADGQLAWRIGQRRPAACATDVRYGVLPPGYVQIAPARPLVSGGRYRVAITGAGFNEATEFVAPAVRPPS